MPETTTQRRRPATLASFAALAALVAVVGLAVAGAGRAASGAVRPAAGPALATPSLATPSLAVPTTSVPAPAATTSTTVVASAPVTAVRASARPAAVQPAPTTPAPVSPTGTGTWALVIGIGDYPGSSIDLPLARKDGELAAAAFTGLGVPASQQRVLLDGAATRKGILDGIAWLRSNAGPTSTSLVVIAGHAFTESKPGAVSLLAADGVAISDTELGQAFAPLTSAHTWFTFATCFAAGFDEVIRPGRVLTAASHANEESYDNSDLGASYLGYYLFKEALGEHQADGDVTSAVRWADTKIAQDYPDRRPVQVRSSIDTGEILL